MERLQRMSGNTGLWCEKQDATLISVNDKDENDFMWRICHTEPDPITFPRNKTRTTCWLGLVERRGTGNKDPPQDSQIWDWLDGSRPETNKWANWANKPGMGDGDGTG